ncbi:YihY/virulence factor BrkB family protein [bacterium]|nr:YihY/virulence factor BrkB family protein [bacterium]
MTFRSFAKLIEKTSVGWHRDRAQRLSAALAFYTVFSLAPILIIIVFLAGLVYGIETTRDFVIERIQILMGKGASVTISSILSEVTRPLPSILAGLFSLMTLLWGATTVFSCLADSLNTIWDAHPHGGRFGIRGFIRHKLLAFLMVIATGVYLVFSLVITTGITAIGAFFKDFFPLPVFIFQLLDFSTSVIMTTVLFAVVFKVVPAVKQQWNDVFPGALVTSVLFVAGKYLIGLYFIKSTLASLYGAAGSFVIILLWIYFSAQILFFGAEYNKVYMRLHGSGSRRQPAGRPNKAPP